ncbi:hypothetical protein BD289DRAFT_164021 [Coniella lustricola]|uniref:Transmembrane protein n=1 Tax=Coniella lustricola TaxID=2025994 RepID=A0A2T3AEG2_9PEZI|nr:hypothetical protein BD289DRAFT_164021 [Coniella lustricola]
MSTLTKLAQFGAERPMAGDWEPHLFLFRHTSLPSSRNYPSFASNSNHSAAERGALSDGRSAESMEWVLVVVPRFYISRCLLLSLSLSLFFLLLLLRKQLQRRYSMFPSHRRRPWLCVAAPRPPQNNKSKSNSRFLGGGALPTMLLFLLLPFAVLSLLSSLHIDRLIGDTGWKKRLMLCRRHPCRITRRFPCCRTCACVLICCWSQLYVRTCTPTADCRQHDKGYIHGYLHGM